MTDTLARVFALSIIIAGVGALATYKKADSVYQPFFLLLWIGSLNEILSVGLVYSGFKTAVNNNIYVLIESLCILWFFRNLRTVFLSNAVFIILVSSFVIFWLVENFIISRISYISSYFRIFYSFIIVILSITAVNHLIVTAKKSLLKIPVFIISMGFIIFFTYKILVEAFWLYGLNNSKDFRNSVYTILVYLNLFVNLLFALSLLWIPRKRESILFS
jgi:hypothetical protein